ncbi:MAG: DUF1800 domain-containing protein [Acidimicrobiia bacterium]|nr:DUF1800 domain-containing protein [Acidimicrobiia bacterium]
MASEQERISHVFRRLGYGSQPDLIQSVDSAEDAIAAALDLSSAAIETPELDPPLDEDAIRDRSQTRIVLAHWLEQLVSSPRRIEERLVWFWHDHFATDLRKVKVPYLMYLQHLTVRRHATGSFADLLHAIAVDPAMLIYLDGTQNAADALNENFGREVMELFTLGRGNYTEDDVLAASRAFTGWIVLRAGGRAERFFDGEPWSARFVPFRHDSGSKTLLGTTGDLDATDAIDVLLEHESTAAHVGAKLFHELIGFWPDPATEQRIAAVFRRDYSVMALVEAIVDDSGFLSEEAIRARIRSPLEKAVGIVQAFGGGGRVAGGLESTLRTMSYIPFVPPSVAGFPEGPRLLDPHRMIHTFDFVALIPESIPELSTPDLMNRLGLYDISEQSRRVVDAAPPGGTRTALAINSPEYHVV